MLLVGKIEANGYNFINDEVDGVVLYYEKNSYIESSRTMYIDSNCVTIHLIDSTSGKLVKSMSVCEFLDFCRTEDVFGVLKYKNTVRVMKCSLQAYKLSTLITYRGKKFDQSDSMESWRFYQKLKSKIIIPSAVTRQGSVMSHIDFDIDFRIDKLVRAWFVGEVIWQLLTQASKEDLSRSLVIDGNLMKIPYYSLTCEKSQSNSDWRTWQHSTLPTKLPIKKKERDSVNWAIKREGFLLYQIDDMKKFKTFLSMFSMMGDTVGGLL